MAGIEPALEGGESGLIRSLRLHRDRCAQPAGCMQKHGIELGLENPGRPEHVNKRSRSLGARQQVGLIHAQRGQALGFS